MGILSLRRETGKEGINPLLGYESVEVLAIYPDAIYADHRGPEYGEWCHARLRVMALCVCDGEIEELAWQDIQTDMANGWLVRI